MDEYDKLYSIILKKYITLDVLRSLIANEHVQYVKPCGVTEDGYPAYELKLDNGDKNILYLKNEIKEFFNKINKILHKKLF